MALDTPAPARQAATTHTKTPPLTQDREPSDDCRVFASRPLSNEVNLVVDHSSRDLFHGPTVDVGKIVASVGSKGDSYDNALAESFNGLYKWELIYRRGLDDVEFATMTYVDWFNQRRLHGEITDDARYTQTEHEAACGRSEALFGGPLSLPVSWYTVTDATRVGDFRHCPTAGWGCTLGTCSIRWFLNQLRLKPITRRQSSRHWPTRRGCGSWPSSPTPDAACATSAAQCPSPRTCSRTTCGSCEKRA